jgi:hypothetical protein
MDGSIYPAAAQQSGVGRIDDGIHGQGGDVGYDGFQMLLL